MYHVLSNNPDAEVLNRQKCLPSWNLIISRWRQKINIVSKTENGMCKEKKEELDKWSGLPGLGNSSGRKCGIKEGVVRLVLLRS